MKHPIKTPKRTKQMEFINNSGLEFKDIDAEEERSYLFPGGTVVTITEPLKLNVSASGGHRIFDAQGNSHYVPAGWVHLTWTVKEGKAHFDF